MFRYICISLVLHIVALVSLGIVIQITSFRVKASTPQVNVITINISNKDSTKLVRRKPNETYIIKDTPKEETKETITQENVNNLFNNNKEQASLEGNIIPPTPLYIPKITYPYIAKINGIEGTVILRIEISTNGDVVDATLIQSSGNQLLDENSLNFVKKIKFIPAKDRNNNPIPLEVDYKVSYILK